MTRPARKTASKKKSPARRKSIAPSRPSAPRGGIEEFIDLRGVRQNNLKGFDLRIPLGKLNVITGPSGSGKSSLAFQTLYAEGQRRYVETFSPYTRQFFDRMDKPQVDAIYGIPPAIAIEQTNTVKTTRSTVGTITELNDYLKLLFPRIATAICPECGEPVRPDTAESIARQITARFNDESVLVTFGVPAPPKTDPAEFFAFLQGQGYLRVRAFGEIYRTDEPEKYPRKTLPAMVAVIQDRVRIAASANPDKPTSRLLEAVEAALRMGKGKISAVAASAGEAVPYSQGWHCPSCDLDLRAPSSSLFSFNNPLGACPNCRGFGRVIGIDLDRALPDKSLSIAEGVVKAFQGEKHYECQEDLERHAGIRGLDLDSPFEDLDENDQEWILYGDYPGDAEKAWENNAWYGVRGFFDWLESRTYKMHVRVFLSRYRSYTTCPECRGTRLQPEALNYRVNGKTLPQIWKLPVNRLIPFVDEVAPPQGDHAGEMLHGEILARLNYLERVGLGYLDLDRPTRTLSGGETERVNLTTCLGASLTNTLFVLDEPTVGLHPRDVSRLVEVMEHLRDNGNTLVVVEHEEAVIRAADHLIDIGPGRGETGGNVVFEGPPTRLQQNHGTRKAGASASLTGDYLSGRKSIPVPDKRRRPRGFLTIERASQHNLKKVDARIPLGVFCCVTGVSGSGKSTLIHSVLYENLIRQFGQSSDQEPGRCRSLHGHENIGEVVMVDQSPLSRTPRSTPAVYTGVFEQIRKLFSETPDAVSRGLTMGYFSFNSGAGRCERCWGNGFEKVEMQFLSDLYVTCPECEGKRYTPEALEIQLDGRNIHEVLNFTVTEAVTFFSRFDDRKADDVVRRLQVLADVGLGYLRLGQPLNTLSGGESQRLKLVGHLLERGSGGKERPGKSPLLIFDEPTTGLHFDDVAILLRVFDRLVETGASILVIEHNLEVIKCADHLIDLGPEAGDQGGEIVATGTPEEVAGVPGSYTGAFLSGILTDTPKAETSALLKAAEEPSLYRITRRARPAVNGAIEVHGAREHNLKNISFSIPRDKFVVVTGLSGSGKSTLAFDILFAEGQRRFLDSMSAYARQFVEQMERPDIDHITGLPPTVAIEQRISRGGGKSTVATVTEVYHFLRLLYSKVGVQYSPDTGKAVVKQSVSSVVSRISEACRQGEVTLLAPVIKARKGFHTEVARWAERQGFGTLLVDGEFRKTEGFERLERFKEHTIDAVVGTFSGRKLKTEDLRAAVEQALRIGKQTARFIDAKGRIHVVSTAMSDPETGRSFEELDPRLFSYNSPHGWCPGCRGYGYVDRKPTTSEDRSAESVLDAELREEYRRSRHNGDGEEESERLPCPACHGARLNEVALHVRVHGVPIHDITSLTVSNARTAIEGLSFSGNDTILARDILPEISQRLKFMEEVGLGYLQLDRSATTLSGGESQRIRLAAQLGSNLRGVLYVLDEPTIGLHPRDNARLLDTLSALRDKGNSLVVVEHDEDTMRRSDYIIDLGPGAGVFGGEITAHGTLTEIQNNKASATGYAIQHPITHPLKGERRPVPAKNAQDGWLRIKGARANNLKNLNVRIPVGRLTVVTGISGSGKSSLMRGVLRPAVESNLPGKRKKKARAKRNAPAPYKSITGAAQIETVYEVDQSPIGKTSRSTPATYVKVFDEIRKLFAQLPEARARGYSASRFSFNTEGGRCETCKGNGQIKLEMNFLPTSYVPCDQCHGARYNSATLEIEYNGRNIGDVMDMSIEEAAGFFTGVPKIHRTMSLLRDTGLGYLKLGQPSPTLSGGEAQRIKLVTELTRGIGRSEHARLRQNRKPKSNLYLIEEPSIGLHMADVRKLLEVLHHLVDDGHTVVIIEHNLDIVAEADYLIDVGPEAGADGGEIVAQGTPEEVAKSKVSRTAPFLKAKLKVKTKKR